MDLVEARDWNWKSRFKYIFVKLKIRCSNVKVRSADRDYLALSIESYLKYPLPITGYRHLCRTPSYLFLWRRRSHVPRADRLRLGTAGGRRITHENDIMCSISVQPKMQSTDFDICFIRKEKRHIYQCSVLLVVEKWYYSSREERKTPLIIHADTKRIHECYIYRL